MAEGEERAIEVTKCGLLRKLFVWSIVVERLFQFAVFLLFFGFAGIDYVFSFIS